MNREEAFPSKWLKGEHLQGKAIKVTVESVEQAKNSKGETMTIVHFRGKDKALILKATTWDQFVTVTGEEDAENWAGHTVILYPEPMVVNGNRFTPIRVRGDVQVVEDEFSEEAPF